MARKSLPLSKVYEPARTGPVVLVTTVGEFIKLRSGMK